MRWFYVLGLIWFAIPAQCDERAPRFVSVNGICQKKVRPDRGIVSFATEFVESTSKKASELAADQQQALIRKIKSMGLKDAQLATSGFTVLPDYEWVKSKQVFKGYKARAVLDVETSQTEKLGDIVAAGLEVNVKQVERVGAFISPTKMREEQASCLEIATKDAMQNAERMARAVGAKIGDPLSISQDGTRAPRNTRQVYAMAKSSEGDFEGSPPIEVKDEDLAVVVTASFELQK